MVSQVIHYLKKLRRGEAIDVREIGKELADLVIYVDLLAANLGLDLEQCVRDKFNEVSDRVGSPIKLECAQMAREEASGGAGGRQ